MRGQRADQIMRVLGADQGPIKAVGLYPKSSGRLLHRRPGLLCIEMKSPWMQRKDQAGGCGETNEEAVAVEEEGDYGLD